MADSPTSNTYNLDLAQSSLQNLRTAVGVDIQSQLEREISDFNKAFAEYFQTKSITTVFTSALKMSAITQDLEKYKAGERALTALFNAAEGIVTSAAGAPSPAAVSSILTFPVTIFRLNVYSGSIER